MYCLSTHYIPIVHFKFKNKYQKQKIQYIEQIQLNQSEFSRVTFSSTDQLVQAREQAMKMFIEDFTSEHSKSKYLSASLPQLPLDDKEFSLSLCSHFLFLYSLQHDSNFHINSIKEMSRVSNHFSIVRAKLESEGYDTELRQVAYEVQKGGNQMLCVQCAE